MAVEIIMWVLAVVLVAGGLVGLLFPVLPGGVMVFGGLLLAAWAEHFQYVGTWTLVFLGVMVVLMYVIDFLAGAFGAKHFGASNRAVVGAALGAVVGIFFGLIGVLVGPFVGAVIGELTKKPGELQAAGKAGVGATIGLAIGVAAKLAMAFAMVGVFALVRFVG